MCNDGTGIDGGMMKTDQGKQTSRRGPIMLAEPGESIPERAGGQPGTTHNCKVCQGDAQPAPLLPIPIVAFPWLGH